MRHTRRISKLLLALSLAGCLTGCASMEQWRCSHSWAVNCGGSAEAEDNSGTAQALNNWAQQNREQQASFVRQWQQQRVVAPQTKSCTVQPTGFGSSTVSCY